MRKELLPVILTLELAAIAAGCAPIKNHYISSSIPEEPGIEISENTNGIVLSLLRSYINADTTSYSERLRSVRQEDRDIVLLEALQANYNRLSLDMVAADSFIVRGLDLLPENLEEWIKKTEVVDNDLTLLILYDTAGLACKDRIIQGNLGDRTKKELYFLGKLFLEEAERLRTGYSFIIRRHLRELEEAMLE